MVDEKGTELCSDESVMDYLEFELGYNGSRGCINYVQIILKELKNCWKIEAILYSKHSVYSSQ